MKIFGVLIVFYCTGVLSFSLIDLVRTAKAAGLFDKFLPVLGRWMLWPYHGIKFIVNFIRLKAGKK